MKIKILLLILVINAGILYVMEGISFSLMFLWILMPFFIGYSIVLKAYKTKSNKKLWEGYNFLILSTIFTYVYHILWFLDIDGTKTGSSTAALVFLWGPIWATIFGYFGYFIGSFVENKRVQ